VSATTPVAAVREVLEQAEGPLHWTVVLDRALRSGTLSPFETPDVRGAVQRALVDLARAGIARRVSTGVWELSAGAPAGP
jgi:hypothetical protein